MPGPSERRREGRRHGGRRRLLRWESRRKRGRKKAEVLGGCGSRGFGLNGLRRLFAWVEFGWVISEGCRNIDLNAVGSECNGDVKNGIANRMLMGILSVSV